METLEQTVAYIWHNLPFILGLTQRHLILVGIAVIAVSPAVVAVSKTVNCDDCIRAANCAPAD